jgi:hypothetical protein
LSSLLCYGRCFVLRRPIENRCGLGVGVTSILGWAGIGASTVYASRARAEFQVSRDHVTLVVSRFVTVDGDFVLIRAFA